MGHAMSPLAIHLKELEEKFLCFLKGGWSSDEEALSAIKDIDSYRRQTYILDNDDCRAYQVCYPGG